ncbi:6-phosphofructokinase [Ruminococcaceae bacterium OttesenSCG-928-A16]|nr:6-phosphofructokinase [Ruminococcaceae bacterium OttesenSCG-928-A16]
MKNLLVAQSGGPTTAINATLAGVLHGARQSGKVGTVYGGLHGIQGILQQKLVNLSAAFATEEELQRLKVTPAAILGSCRYKLPTPQADEAVYKAIVEILQANNIGVFVYIGGNDSMDTVAKLSAYFKQNKVDIAVMGAPKTIDNDLCETDHTPGFGSAAKYVAFTFAELVRDCHVYPVASVTVVEVMGRDAGWLTASAALANVADKGPDFICLPEHPFNEEAFLQKLAAPLQQHRPVVVAVSEGIKTATGAYVGEQSANATDAFGHKQLAGVGQYLEKRIKERYGCKVRSVQLNLMQRCAAHLASATDLNEAFELGSTAALAGAQGTTGQMACIQRLSNTPYTVSYQTTPVEKVANQVKHVPKEWITPDGSGVTQEMIDYLLPLVQGHVEPVMENGLPSYAPLFY